MIQFLVLIPHAPHGAEHRAEMQRTDKHFALVAQRGTRQFLWKPPNLAAPRDRSLVVEIHRMNVDSLLAAEADRDHLAAFGEIAEAGRIRQADEFKFDDWVGYFEGLWHDSAQGAWIGKIFDHEIFTIIEMIGSWRIGWIVERQGESARTHICDFHLKAAFGREEAWQKPDYNAAA